MTIHYWGNRMKNLILICFLLFAVTSMAVGTDYKAYDDTFNNTTIYSKAMKILNYHHVSMQIVYTTTAGDGVCEMQVSNDGINFEIVANSGALLAATGGSVGSIYVNKANIAAVFMRAACTSNDTNPIVMTITLTGK